MVPERKVPARLLVNGVETPFEKRDVGGSLYVDAAVRPERGVADFEVVYADGEIEFAPNEAALFEVK
jgi:hypothetical protein